MFQFPEHLRSFQTVWARIANTRATLMVTAEARAEVQAILKQAPQRQAAGVLPQYEQQSIRISEAAKNQNVSPTLPLYPIFTPSGANTSAILQRNSGIDHRDNEQLASGSRSRRTCRRCGQTSDICGGARSVKNCQNPCQDCGDKDCGGRNPKNFKNQISCDRSGNRKVRD